MHCNSHDPMKSGSNTPTSLDCFCLPVWMALKRWTFDRPPIRMPCLLMQTDKKDMKVQKSVSMHSHAFERPCKRQLVTDTKLRNASHMFKQGDLSSRHKINGCFFQQILTQNFCLNTRKHFFIEVLFENQQQYP